jgi:hypothetical protein
LSSDRISPIEFRSFVLPIVGGEIECAYFGTQYAEI